ncbi:Mov34/MPN/PAD-1 family protein [Microbacterium sp. 1P10AE]|uniref:Mov34/MPN/PAD-1 family protein n=1 Tax=Microbacterium sp. 1P10AE TaxID=3132286 RepID=UPI0039A17C6F
MTFAIVTSPTALALASRYAREAAPFETGGILLGWHQRSTIVVHEFLSVPDPRATNGDYKRGHREASDSLKRYLDDAEDSRLGYVGEWHSHPRSSVASATDISSLAAIAKGVRSPVALIVLILENGAADVTVDSRVGCRGVFGQIRVQSAHLTAA